MSLRLHINAVGAVMGGAARHLPPFVGAVVKARPDWELVVYCSPDGLPLPVPGVRVRTVQRKSWQRIVWDSVTVGRVAARDGADILINLANYGPILSPVPSILYQRNPIYFDPVWVRRMGIRHEIESFVRRAIAFSQIRGSAAVVVPSNAMAAYLRSWRGCPPDTRIEVIPHSVDIGRFTFTPAANLTRSRTSVRIVSLSHAAPHKGQELLIAMMKELRERGIDADLEATISEEDDPKYVASLRNLIDEAGLGQHVRFVGRVDAAQFLSQADVMVLPSITESFGFPIIEAMACGVPVVASSIPSTTEVLGHSGWYFPVGDASAATDQVVAVLEHDAESLRAQLLAAHDLATTYSWERNARQVVSLVEGIVSATQ